MTDDEELEHCFDAVHVFCQQHPEALEHLPTKDLVELLRVERQKVREENLLRYQLPIAFTDNHEEAWKQVLWHSKQPQPGWEARERTLWELGYDTAIEMTRKLRTR